MYIPTRSIPVAVPEPLDVLTLWKNISLAARVLAAELDEHATGRSVTVCLEAPVEMINMTIDGMPVYVIGPNQGYPTNTVHLGHGVDNFESFKIPPAGCLDV